MQRKPGRASDFFGTTLAGFAAGIGVAYTVLARKYRSRTFDEVIGQGPIATTLSNAVSAGRIHHGYLFTGTRGSGKTSMARILAKSLNCLKSDAPTPKPCLECDACRAISEGQDIDVVEIDAASNTGVDNIRELRSNAAFRPARSRFKVYIIDEVHMLSTGAFNALLKTLEEPPEHVKFILATTEIQKVPATIQSRCQRFNFRNIGAEDIAGRLRSIAADEKVQLDEGVARRLARLANGSMRDALSLLDQLLSVSPKKIDAKLLEEILPPAQDEQVFELIRLASQGDAAGVLTKLESILSGGRGLETLCNDAIETVRTLLLISACGSDTPLADVPAGGQDDYVKLAAAFDLSQFIQMIGMLEELRRNVRFSLAGRALADAAFVRIARLSQWTSVEKLLAVASSSSEGDEKKKPPLTAPVPVRPVGPDDPPRSAPLSQVAPAGDRTGLTPAVTSGDYRPAEPQSPLREPVAASPIRASQPHARQPSRTAAATAERTPIPAAEEINPDFDSPPLDVMAAGYAEPEDGAAAFGDDDAGGAAAYDRSSAAPSAASQPLGRLPATTEERSRIQADPLVKQVIEVFGGMLINMERVMPVPGGTVDAAPEPDDTE